MKTDSRLKKRGAKNGRDVWTAVLPLSRGSDGARRQRRFSFVGNKKDAEKALIAELAAIGNGTFVAPDRTTLGQYLAGWLESSKPSFAGKTWERFEGMARVHIIPALGDVVLQRLTAQHLSKAYAAWRESGLAGQTVIHHHRLLHRVLAQALREGRVRQNVAAIADKPKAARREMRFLTTDEIARIFAVAEGTRFSSLIALALATGARRGELCGLKWDDVDLARGTISIRRSLEQTRAGVAEKSPKSGKSRVVVLTAGAIETLRRHRLSAAQSRGIGSIAGSSYVFPGEEGGPWRPHMVTDGFRDLARRCGIVPLPARKRATTRAGRRPIADAPKEPKARRPAEITFHSLRHTCASMMLAQGVHPKIVQEVLGHSSVSVTMDLYSHVTPTLQSEAAQRLDAVLLLPAAGSATA
ncbi:MAG: tyrosine-type recombinase/integrase [Vulcanimicrobiaceae bacterium]